jgi:hypothetical protein
MFPINETRAVRSMDSGDESGSVYCDLVIFLLNGFATHFKMLETLDKLCTYPAGQLQLALITVNGTTFVTRIH